MALIDVIAKTLQPAPTTQDAQQPFKLVPPEPAQEPQLWQKISTGVKKFFGVDDRPSLSFEATSGQLQKIDQTATKRVAKDLQTAGYSQDQIIDTIENPKTPPRDPVQLAAETGKEFFQGINRFAVRLANFVPLSPIPYSPTLGDLTGKKAGLGGGESFTPTSPAERLLLGNEEFGGFSKAGESLITQGAGLAGLLAKKAGIDGITPEQSVTNAQDFLKSKLGQNLAPFIGILGTSFEAYPGGFEGKKVAQEVIDQLIKKYGAEAAKEIVEKGTKDLVIAALKEGGEQAVEKAGINLAKREVVQGAEVATKDIVEQTAETTAKTLTKDAGFRVATPNATKESEAVLQAAVKQGVPDPERIAVELGDLYKSAPLVKSDIDAIAREVADLYDSQLTTAPIKGYLRGAEDIFNPNRAVEKYVTDGYINDLARNTIIVDSDKIAQQVIRDLETRGVQLPAGKNFFDEPTYLGYRGANLYRKTPAGIGEVQVNIPEMVYFKEPPEVAKNILGEQLYKKIETANPGLKPGRGHEIYAEVRRYETIAEREGRFVKQDGRKIFKWTNDERKVISPLIDESRRSYNELIKSAKARPSISLKQSGLDIAKAEAADLPEGTVKQIFRGDKLNITPKQLAEIEKRREALGLTTRTIRSFEDVKAAAVELGTDVASLLKETATGRITDKEVAGLRNLINNNARFISNAEAEIATNPANATLLQEKIDIARKQIDDALKKLIKGGTEAGRTVSAFRILAENNMEPQFWYTQAKKMLGDREFTPEIQRAIDDLIGKSDRNGLATFISMLRKSDFSEKAITLWKAGLLTSPTTHLANILGNVTMSALETATNVVGTGFDVLASLVTGKRTVTISPQTIAAKLQGFKTGALKAAEFFKSGIYPTSLLAKYDIPRQVVFDNKLLQGYTNGIFRSLSSEDIIFRQAAMSESLEQQAILMAKNEGLKGTAAKERVKELLLKPTNEMVMSAIDAAEYATFNNKNSLADIIAAGKRTVATKGPAGKALNAALEFIAPFARTPTNVAARIADYTPAGFLKAVVNSVMKKGQGQVVKDLARATVGTSFIALGALLASKGLMTGNAPTSGSERDQFYAEGKQPNSIRIGDTWYQLNRISPLGNLLAIGANFEKLSQDQSGASLVASTVGSTVKGLTDQTFLQGVSGALGAITEPDKKAERFVEQSASSFVPTIIGRTARTIDPTLRNPEGVIDAIKAKIPVLSETVPARRDVFGEPVVAGGGRAALVDPFNTTAANDDPILQEATRIGVAIGLPSQTISGIKLTNAEYEVYQKVQGRLLKQTLQQLIKAPQYTQAPIDKQEKIMKNTITNFRQDLNDKMLPYLMIQRYELPTNTNPDQLNTILSKLGKEAKFKQMNESRQGEIVKKLLGVQ